MKHLFVLICIFSLSFTLSAQKIGLVLSGGGAKGLAHIGLIKVLEENNIPIDYIAGTSMGAIVAAMYASGMSADEMVAIVTGSDFQNWALGNVSEEYKYQFLKREEDASWLDLNFNLDSGFKPQIPTGMIPTHSMDFAFMEYFAPPSAAAGYDFDSLFVPFRCVASDVNLREAVIFSEGDLGSAVRASMAAPFYFSPVVIKGKLLFDGGIYNNFPVDVLIKDFNPDYIIGCNVSHNSTPASEENPLLQLENMIVAPTDYSVPPEKGVLIEPDIQGIKFADFSKAWEIIDRGYQESLNNIDEIKANVHRCVSVEERETARKKFKALQPPFYAKNIFTTGLTYTQSVFLMRSILQRKDSVGLNDFRNAYYRIIEDDQIESIFPRAKYNPSSGMYNLYLKVKKEKRFKARIGGNVSSGNLNMVHLGIEHKVLGRNSLSLYANSYFGRYYSSLLANVRARFYTESPFYTDFSVFANQYDFYKSSFDLFYNEEHPPYLIQREMAARMMLVFPSGHTGKMELGMTGGKISDNYYNASFFLMTDTADKSVFTFFSPFLRLFYINTNFIQFPTRGKKTSLTLRFTDFAEDFQPGSLSGGVRKKQNDIYAFDFSLLSERYINISKYFKTGYLFHLHLSQRPFMSNYYSSLVTSPAYEPFPLAGTLFLEEFRAPQFVGAGARFLVCFSDRFHARMEGHYFQPYRKILSDSNGQPYYGEALANYSVAAQAALVYQAPFGPISLTGCYFSDHSREFYLVFNIGYLIYNRRAIDW